MSVSLFVYISYIFYLLTFHFYLSFLPFISTFHFIHLLSSYLSLLPFILYTFYLLTFISNFLFWSWLHIRLIFHLLCPSDRIPKWAVLYAMIQWWGIWIWPCVCVCVYVVNGSIIGAGACVPRKGAPCTSFF